MVTEKVPHILFGGDYNPEQWPRETWVEDARLMREAGVNLVTVGVFSWAKLEPEPDRYEFEWLDDVLDLLDEHGVRVDLATATASPPPWMGICYPETLPVTEDGVRLWPGSRQQYCPSSPVYRERAGILVERLASRYGDHPSLAMWHVNNEYGCHVPACYCDTSAEGFRRWLELRYGSIDALNEAWGTSFWSQRYAAFTEVNPPRSAPTFKNPTQQLDFHRFCSDTLLECYELEAEILRKHSPDTPVTTNFMGFFKPCDYWRWAAREDVVSHDSYPDPSDPRSPGLQAMSFDLMRSLAGKAPWILMEQASNGVNWRRRNAAKRPGQMRLFSYQAVARGADGVLYFQWRASRAGAEKFHSGMVPHGGIDTRTFREVAQLGNELGRLDQIVGSNLTSSVAIAFDWNNWWALELPSKPSADLRMIEQVAAWYLPLYRDNIAVDFVHPEQDLSSYGAVIAPCLYLMSEDAAENLARFVADGGTLLMSFFSGIVDERDHIRLGGYPAPFREMLQMKVGEFWPLMDDETIDVTFAGDSYACELWAEMLELEGAEPLAHYRGGWLDARAAVTRSSFGEGEAVYVSGMLEEPGIHRLLTEVLERAGIERPDSLPQGVEMLHRAGEGSKFSFVLNHNEAPVSVDLSDGHRVLIGPQPERGRLHLRPYDVAVLEEPFSG
jgi:beta-galactosidase